MSKAQLKKHLSALTKEQIIEVILELYDARKEAKEYLEFYLNPNDDQKLEEYKKSSVTSSFLEVANPNAASTSVERQYPILRN